MGFSTRSCAVSAHSAPLLCAVGVAIVTNFRILALSLFGQPQFSSVFLPHVSSRSSLYRLLSTKSCLVFPMHLKKNSCWAGDVACDDGCVATLQLTYDTGRRIKVSRAQKRTARGLSHLLSSQLTAVTMLRTIVICSSLGAAVALRPSRTSLPRAATARSAATIERLDNARARRGGINA